MKSILTTIAFLALAVSGLAQTRSVIVNTSGVVQSPTNFWSADVVNARSGLGLGTAATNPATAFQPSSLVLSNLSSSNGGALTNLTASRITGTVALASNVTGTVALASNVTGTIAISNGGSGATTAGGARTNFGLGAFSTNEVGFGNVKMSSSGINFIEPTDAEIVFGLPNDTDPVYLNPIHWNDGGVRTALGLGLSVLTNTNISNFRTAIGLGVTNNVTFGGLTAGFVNFENVEIGPDLKLEEDGDVLWGTFGRFNVDTMEFSKAISFNNTTNAAATRTNLGLGWSALTNTNTATSLLGITTNGQIVANTGTNTLTLTNLSGVVLQNGPLAVSEIQDNSGNSIFMVNDQYFVNVSANSGVALDWGGSSVIVGLPISFAASSNAATTRTNLGLGWIALTNTNTAGFNTSLYGSGTNPVLYNTNGEVVSPTNFWQVAPIVTRFVEFDPSTNATTNIVAARNLHIHSLAISRTGVTSTIALPTTNSFNGDIALVVHEGPTSSVTQVRTQGSTNNLVTMNRTEEAVEFVYYNSVWQFNHNRSFVEPIYFSGTNAAANAGASRTNLGLGATWLTNTNVTNFRTAIGLGGFRKTDGEVFAEIYSGEDLRIVAGDSIEFYEAFGFSGTNAAAFASDSRASLGLGATNNVTFSALTLSSDLTLGSGDNIVLSTTTGTKIGTATNQLLGFYNQTPITRPSSTGVTTSGFTANGPGNGVHADSRFTGGIGTNAYTISDVVAHLKSLGLLAP